MGIKERSVQEYLFLCYTLFTSKINCTNGVQLNIQAGV
jgi:hypothetical protein